MRSSGLLLILVLGLAFVAFLLLKTPMRCKACGVDEESFQRFGGFDVSGQMVEPRQGYGPEKKAPRNVWSKNNGKYYSIDNE